jgi:hypothetical protein
MGWSREEVIEVLNDFALLNDSIYDLTFLDTTSDVNAIVTGPCTIAMKYSTAKDFCDTMQLEFSRCDCGEEALNNMLISRERKWIWTSDSTYLSTRWFWKTKAGNQRSFTALLLTVHKDVSASVCMHLRVVPHRFTATEWRTIRRS